MDIAFVSFLTTGRVASCRWKTGFSVPCLNLFEILRCSRRSPSTNLARHAGQMERISRQTRYTGVYPVRSGINLAGFPPANPLWAKSSPVAIFR